MEKTNSGQNRIFMTLSVSKPHFKSVYVIDTVHLTVICFALQLKRMFTKVQSTKLWQTLKQWEGQGVSNAWHGA